MRNQERSHLCVLALFLVLPACSSSTSSGPSDGGDNGGAIASGGATNVGTGTGGAVGTGGKTGGGTGGGGAVGSGGRVGSDAGVGRDGARPVDSKATSDLAVDACTGDACTVAGRVARPSYNTGTGFFVKDGKLYDAAGVEFRMRGVDKCHYDAAWPGIPNTHANTIRWGVPLWLAGSVTGKLMQDSINAKIVPMAGVWYTAGTYANTDMVTCKDETAPLTTAVSQWVAQAATFKPFEKYVLINIANEWGPSGSVVWRDAYISAVAKLRAAGYLSTLVIDAGGCGQDPTSIANYAKAVFDSDPQQNIVFDIHIYGNWSNGGGQSWQTDLTRGLDSLAATGLPIIVGEFGAGRNLGGSPTLITPGEIITAAETRGMGWLAWAWDDPPSNATETDFALSRNGQYASSADLTSYGKDVVENATYGLLHLAQPATIF
jgi:mannan endo-1,4-beta-mannosidase